MATKPQPKSGFEEFPEWNVKLRKFAGGMSGKIFWLGLVCLIAIFIYQSCSSSREAARPVASGSARTIGYCSQAPATFQNGSGELRFRKNIGIPCYELDLNSSGSGTVFMPLGIVYQKNFIELITPGELEVDFRDGRKFFWNKTEADILNPKNEDINFGIRCLVFKVRGQGRVRIVSSVYEALDPNGIVTSTHCEGVY